jgi:hypothetical protein
MNGQLFSRIDAPVRGECETAERQVAGPCGSDGRRAAVFGAIEVGDGRPEVVLDPQESALFLGGIAVFSNFRSFHGKHS